MARGFRKGRPIALELWFVGKTTSGENAYLEKAAAESYLRMVDFAARDKVEWTINSAFRHAETQERLWRRHQIVMAAWEKSGKLGARPSPVAQPGFSLHQSGLSIDLNRAAGDNPATPAPDSPVDLWLRANAHHFGFVADVATEPWHWTYLPERAALNQTGLGKGA